jgi:hypothetical protein
VSRTREPDEPVDPQQLGAKDCPLCGSTKIDLVLRSLDGARFAVISCTQCSREATSAIHSRAYQAVGECINRWNSVWPEVGTWLDADSEGRRHVG